MTTVRGKKNNTENKQTNKQPGRRREYIASHKHSRMDLTSTP